MNEIVLKDAPDRRSGFPRGTSEASRGGEAAQSQSDIPYRALFDAIDQGFSVVDLIFDEVRPTGRLRFRGGQSRLRGADGIA